MPFNIRYFGAQNPADNPDAQPTAEFTWDKLPMGSEPFVDWKTGTIRTPMFQPDAPAPMVDTGLDIPDFGDAGGGGEVIPTDPQYKVTMGTGTRGETGFMTVPDTTSWTYGDVATSGSAFGPAGLEEWYVSRVVYDYQASAPVLYAMMRKRVFSPNGLLYSVSGEVAVEIDTPRALST